MALAPEPVLFAGPDLGIPNGNSVRVLGVSDQLFAGTILPIGYVYKVQSGEMEFLAGPEHPVANRNPQEVQVVGDHVLWWEGRSLTGDIWRLMHWTEEAGTEVLLEHEDASSYYLRTDGVDLAWVQAYDFDGRGFTRWELWTAPHTRVRAELSPRRVREIFVRDHLEVGGGFAHQIRRDSRALQAVRLTDGALFEFPLEDGWNVVSRPIAPSEEGVLWSIQTSPGNVRLFRLTWDAYTRVE